MALYCWQSVTFCVSCFEPSSSKHRSENRHILLPRHVSITASSFTDLAVDMYRPHFPSKNQKCYILSCCIRQILQHTPVTATGWTNEKPWFNSVPWKRNSSLLQYVQTGYGTLSASYSKGIDVLNSAVKRRAGSSPSSSAKVMNEWSYNSTLSYEFAKRTGMNCAKQL